MSSCLYKGVAALVLGSLLNLMNRIRTGGASSISVHDKFHTHSWISLRCCFRHVSCLEMEPCFNLLLVSDRSGIVGLSFGVFPQTVCLTFGVLTVVVKGRGGSIEVVDGIRRYLRAFVLACSFCM